MIEKIQDQGKILAIILRNSYDKEGLNFITDPSHSFQVGFHNVKNGKHYKAHESLPFDKLENFNTNKIYYVKDGQVNIGIYNLSRQRIKDVGLSKGDLILFVSGGHSMDVTKDSKIIEIKQGPYRGVEEDKNFLE